MDGVQLSFDVYTRTEAGRVLQHPGIDLGHGDAGEARSHKRLVDPENLFNCYPCVGYNETRTQLRDQRGNKEATVAPSVVLAPGTPRMDSGTRSTAAGARPQAQAALVIAIASLACSSAIMKHEISRN